MLLILKNIYFNTSSIFLNDRVGNMVQHTTLHHKGCTHNENLFFSPFFCIQHTSVEVQFYILFPEHMMENDDALIALDFHQDLVCSAMYSQSSFVIIYSNNSRGSEFFISPLTFSSEINLNRLIPSLGGSFCQFKFS